MGVYLPNMEMPKSCSECRFAVDGRCCAYGKPNVDALSNKGRTNWCPLVPVPPHGRLIDADAALRNGWTINRTYSASPTETVYEVKAIDCLPIIIEADDRVALRPDYADTMNYCLNCGAYMRGGDEA